MWVIHLEPQTTDHRPQTECTGTSTGTNQQTKHKGHQPSAIAHRTKATVQACLVPTSEGSCQNPDTRERLADCTLLAQLHCTVNRTVFSSCVPSDALHERERPLQSTAVSLMPATCNVAATKKKTQLQFRSHADGLACLEHPSNPVATSGPAQSIPTLLTRRQKDPLAALPTAILHRRTYVSSTTTPTPRFAAQMLDQKAFWQYILVCAQM